MLRQDPNSLARRAESLRRAGELAGGERPFALVTVVRTEPSTSARIGDRAIVFADGSLDGWVGGGCIGPTARKEALAALEEGVPRLVRVTPDTAAAQPGVRMARMTCASEGTADLYVEPFLPRPTLIVAGDSPVAATLAAIAPPLGFRLLTMDATTRLTPGEVPYPQDSWMVVATFGEFDEDAVEAGIRLGLPYVGLVASARRAGQVLSGLRDAWARGGRACGGALPCRAAAGHERPGRHLPLRHGGDLLAARGVASELLGGHRSENRPENTTRPWTRSAGWRSRWLLPGTSSSTEAPSTTSAAPDAGGAFEQEPEKYAAGVSLR